jgi:homoserine kinase
LALRDGSEGNFFASELGMTRVCVRVPATSANLGPGFDALGVALGLHNVVEIGFSEAPHVAVTGEGADELPSDRTNLVYRAASALADVAGARGVHFALRCENRIPLARGLGGSAAAIVAGLVGANELLGRPVDLEELVRIAARLEGHPDNVVPALVGGFTVAVAEGERVWWTRIPVLDPPLLVVGVPEFALPTTEARRRLPDRVAFEDAVANTGRAALLVAALVTRRLDLLGVATEDRLHQPYRKPLVPGFEAVCRAAREAGAAGVALSGAGPSVVAFAEADRAEEVAQVMERAFGACGVRARAIVTHVDPTGTQVVERPNNGGGERWDTPRS